MMYSPLPHGAYADEIVFAIAALLSLGLFVYLAIADKKRGVDANDDEEDRAD